MDFQTILSFYYQCSPLHEAKKGVQNSSSGKYTQHSNSRTFRRQFGSDTQEDLTHTHLAVSSAGGGVFFAPIPGYLLPVPIKPQPLPREQQLQSGQAGGCAKRGFRGSPALVQLAQERREQKHLIQLFSSPLLNFCPKTGKQGKGRAAALKPR